MIKNEYGHNAEQVIQELIRHPRMVWNEKIVMPSDKESKNERTNRRRKT